MNRIAIFLLLLCCLAQIDAYAQPPAPGVTGNTVVCTGTSTALTATGQAGSTFRWWDAPTGGNLKSTSATYTIPVQGTAGTFHWYVEQTATDGLTGPRTDVAVTVNQSPIVGISPSNPIICNGSSTTLTGSGATTYSWQPGNLSGNSISVSPTTNTTYTVTGTTNGCSATSGTTVTVNKTIASADATICYGGGASATLSASGASTYVWTPGNLSGASVSVSPLTTTTYIVSGTGSGCTTTDTVVVTVQPSMGLTVSANATVTEGTIVTLTCSSVLPATYVWSANPGDLNGLSGNSAQVVPTETTTYTVTGTHANGCTAIANTLITVSKLAAVSGTTILCPGASTILTAAGTAPFTWYDAASGGNLVYTGPTYTTPALSNSTSYWVSANGGPRKEVKLQVIPNTIDSATATPAAVCIGDTARLQTTYGGLVRWYDAATGGNQVGTSTASSSLKVTPSLNTTYYAEAVPVQINLTFSYTGAVQTWTVPNGITSITVDAYGSAGERVNASKGYTSKGGRVQAVMNVTPGQVLSIYVGGKENFNGGGPRALNSGIWMGPRGGDATDIRIGGTGLSNRVLVAGGGGGTGWSISGSTDLNTNRGDGGNLNGQNGSYQNFGSGPSYGSGASQSAGGSGGVMNGVTNNLNAGLKGIFGQGGRSGAYSSQWSGGPGGGGWYGGGGGTATGDGGGGSSYTNPIICQNVVHTQGAWDDVGVVFISYGAPCAGTGTRVPVTVAVKPIFKPVVSDTLANACAGSAVTLVASGLAPSGQVGSFDGTQAAGPSGSGGNANIGSVANDFTMEFWVKPGSTITPITPSTAGGPGTSGQRYAIMPFQSGNNAGAGVSVGTNAISVFEHGNGYLPALLTYSASIPDTAFTHVAVVYTAKQPRLYVNGSLVATGLTSTMPNIYPSIGSDGTGGYGAFIGQLDNVRYWNAPLSQAEIMAILGKADTSIPGKTLVARYSFNGGSRLDDKGTPAQAQWTTLSNNPQQDHYLYTWAASAGAAPAASGNEKQTTTAAAGTTGYWVKAKQNGCIASSDTTYATTDPIPAATITGATSICQNGTAPVIFLDGSGSTAPYTFTYNINGGASQTAAATNLKTRYVRIGQNGSDWLNIAEIRAIQSGTNVNVASGKTGTGTTNGSFPIPNLTDGNTGNYWHSNGMGTGQYVEIDLGAPYLLDHVEIVNRQDCCWERLANLQLIFKDSTGFQFSSRQINAYQGQNTNYTTSWASTPSTAGIAAPTNVAGNFQYNLVSVTSANGCTNTQNSNVQVTVAAAPAVTLSTNPGTSVCSGTAVTVSPSVTNATSPSYQWTRNGIAAGTGSTYTSGTLSNGDSIAVRVTTTGTCAATPAAAYVKMRVSPYPAASLSGPACSGDTLSLSAATIPTQVQWQSNFIALQTNAATWTANATTVAGGSNGNALNQLNDPRHAFVDAAGNVYVPDMNNHRVVKWAPGASAGVIVAGGNGAGAAANQLNGPISVYVDAAQNLYIAEINNHRIQKWAAGATSGTMVAGTGNAGSAVNELSAPINVTMDAYGNLYIADCYNHRIQKWAAGATSGTTVAGNATNGTGLNNLSYPYTTKVDGAGNIYVLENGNHRVTKWTPGSTTGILAAGTGSSGSGANQFLAPTDLDIDGMGNLYIADQFNHRIQRWAPGASSGTTVAGTGTPGSAPSQFNVSFGIMLDTMGNLYATDLGNGRVQKFALNSNVSPSPLTAAGSYTAVVTSFAGCATTTAPKTVNQKAVINTNPATSLAVCEGNPISLSVTAAYTTSYRWLKEGNNIPGATAANYVKIGSVTGDAGTYSVVAMSSNGCNDTSASSTVAVTALPNTLAGSNASASNLHTDGLDFNYTDASCQPIAEVADATGGNILGTVQTVVKIDGTVQSYNGTPYLQRHYDIQPGTNGAAVVKLYATQAEFDAYNTYVTANSLGKPLMPTGPSDAAGITHLNVVQYHGLSTAGTSGPGGQYDAAQREVIANSAITTTWNGSYWTMAFPVSGFSGFFISTGTMTPLAITLDHISARNIGARNQVDWSTASESTGDYMEVERSFNGKDFARIATVAGKSVTGAAYTLSDDQPATGINYYRVKMRNTDGSSSYSQTVTARVKDGSFAVAVFPNPATDRITVQAGGAITGTASITITDASGKIVRTATMNSAEISISLSDLAAGYYLLHYQDDAHNQNIKVIKNNR